MQSETGFPSSHQLKSYVAYKSRLKLAARAVLSADAGLLVTLGYIGTRGTGRPFTDKLNEFLYYTVYYKRAWINPIVRQHHTDY